MGAEIGVNYVKFLLMWVLKIHEVEGESLSATLCVLKLLEVDGESLRENSFN